MIRKGRSTGHLAAAVNVGKVKICLVVLMQNKQLCNYMLIMHQFKTTVE